MNSARENIYKIARLSANVTQEQAAEMIGRSPRSISAYEIGETIPDNLTVHLMIQAYGVKTKWLAYMHIKQNSDLGRYFPEISEMSMERMVLNLLKESAELMKVLPRMTEIACNGVIEDDERDDWEECKKEVRELCSIGTSFSFSEF